MLSIIIALILVGLLLLIVEILVIPGTGVVGIVGFIMIAAGIYQTYSSHGVLTGNSVLAGTFILSVVAVYLSIRSKTWNKAILATELEGRSPSAIIDNISLGDTGIAVSRLAPAGTAVFGEVKCEVHTLGDFVDAGDEIVIIKIDRHKIIVKPINK